MKKKPQGKTWVTIVEIIDLEGQKSVFPVSVVAENKHYALKAVRETLREQLYVQENGELLPHQVVGFRQLRPEEVEYFMEEMADLLNELQELPNWR